MEAKIECDLIFIRAAEEIAGLSWKQDVLHVPV